MTSISEIGERLFSRVLRIRNGAGIIDRNDTTSRDADTSPTTTTAADLESTMQAFVSDLEELMVGLRKLSEGDSTIHAPLEPGISARDITSLMRTETAGTSGGAALAAGETSTTTSLSSGTAAIATASALLSVNHFRAIYSVIEVLCRCVLIPSLVCSFPFYSEGFGTEISSSSSSNSSSTSDSKDNSGAVPSHPKSLILDYKTVTDLGQLAPATNPPPSIASLQWSVFAVVVDVLTSPAFSGMMASRNYKRLIAYALHIVNTAPTSDVGLAANEVFRTRLTASMDEESQRAYVTALKDLIHMGKSATTSTEASTWFLQQCGAMLTAMITERQGLKAVLQAFLDNTFAERDAARLQDQVCRTVTSVPAGTDKQTYFGLLLPQVAALLWVAQEQNDLLLLRVCVTLCNRAAALCPAQVARHVIMRLLQPLLSYGATRSQYDILKSYYPDQNQLFDGDVLATEVAMKRCVEICYHIIKIVPPTLQLLQVLQRSGVIMCLLALHSYLVSEAPVSVLCRPCAEICRYLMCQDLITPGVVDDLQSLMLQSPVNKYRLGSMGGVEVVNGNVANSGAVEKEEEEEEENELLSMLRGPLGKVKLTSDALVGEESELAKESLEHLSALLYQLSKVKGSTTKGSNGGFIPKAIAVAKSIGSLFEDANSRGNESDEKNKSSQGSIGSIVASTLFMRAIESFAIRPDPSEPPTAPNNSNSKLDKSQSGVILLALQSHVPLHVMLANGLSIIGLIRSVLQSYADQLVESSEYIERDPLRRDEEVGSSSSSYSNSSNLSRSPLIQEVTTSESSILNVVGVTPSESKGFPTGVDDKDKDKDDLEAVDMCLSILGTMLAFGSASRSAEEEAALRGLLAPLQSIAGLGGSASVAQAASDVAVAIMTRSVPEAALMKAALSAMAPNSSAPSNSATSASGAGGPVRVESQSRAAFRHACERALNESFQSEHPALRSLGIKELMNATKALNQSGDIREADLVEVLDMVLNLLEDPDSFVYLSAIHAIRSLIEMNRRAMFSRILNLYKAPSAWTEKHFRVRIKDSESGDVILTRNITRRRALLGEALSFGVRKLGDIMGTYAPEVIAVCISVAKRAKLEGASQVAADSRVASGWNINSMHISESSDGSAQTSSSASVSASTDVPSKADVEQAAAIADRALLRQSAVSLIADTVATAGFGSLPNLNEVVRFASDILEVEHSNEKLSIAMRRSAIFLIRYVIAGLDKKIFDAKDPGELLHIAYNRAKIAMGDSDKIVRFHAECAYGVIDGLMRRQLFLNEEGSVAAENRARGPLIRIL